MAKKSYKISFIFKKILSLSSVFEPDFIEFQKRYAFLWYINATLLMCNRPLGIDG